MRNLGEKLKTISFGSDRDAQEQKQGIQFRTESWQT